MRKYNKKEYLKYVRELEKDFPDLNSKDIAIDFKTWKEVQPIADKAAGMVNKAINKRRILEWNVSAKDGRS